MSNDKLLGIVPADAPLADAFLVADDVLRQGIVGVSEIIVKPGLINVDFADVRAVMQDAGAALIGIGTGRGASRAEDAALPLEEVDAPRHLGPAVPRQPAEVQRLEAPLERAASATAAPRGARDRAPQACGGPAAPRRLSEALEFPDGAGDDEARPPRGRGGGGAGGGRERRGSGSGCARTPPPPRAAQTAAA